MIVSEAECERLALEDPQTLIAAMATMESPLLTFAAEHLGRAPADVAIPALIPLLRHEKPYVREGAVYGLAAHFPDARALAAVQRTLRDDSSPGVHQATVDVMYLVEIP